MKTFKHSFSKTLIIIFLTVFGAYAVHAQIHMEGFYSQGEGGAGWDADGSGPEPFGDGHGNVVYYMASCDYVDSSLEAGGHFLPGMTGFETFEQALSDNGFTPEQVKFALGLASLGEDIQGLDYFYIGNTEYSIFKPYKIFLKINGELMISGTGNYSIASYGPETGYEWNFESSYFTVKDVSQFSSPEVQALANAFMLDMEGLELKLSLETVFTGVYITGNGRNGGYYDETAILEKGLPEIPIQGISDDHEGFAGWDADGTGPEPYGNGHGTQLYYGASLDYDDIDTDPDACLGHFLDGSSGFLNTLIQLQYRGFEISDLKMKLGLNSLGPDVFGEDWEYGWCNYYNNSSVIELNGEPILAILQDTNRLESMPSYWQSEMGIGKIYDVSSGASPDAQFVAQSFLRDVGTHYLKTITSNIQYVSLFSGNGRDGALYEIAAGKVIGVHSPATFIPESSVYGIWTPDKSPYYIDGHITIENGRTLTIQPGVKVAVRGPYSFNVMGQVLAEGIADEQIIFTHSNPILMWDGFGYYGEYINPEDGSKFDHCVFEYGFAYDEQSSESGGIFAVGDYDNIVIENSTFRHNQALSESGTLECGGAIALSNSSPMISKCIFYDNAAEYGGALFSFWNSEPIIANCLFYENYAEYGGAVSFYNQGDGILINNTITGNFGIFGGGLYFSGECDPEIINTVLWGNEAESSGDQAYFSIFNSYPGFYYSDIQGGEEGFGGSGFYGEYLDNIDEDPLFEGDNSDYPFMITGDSPCVDMGTPDSSPWYYPQYLPETCLAGCPRIYNDRIDIGAYEFMIVNTPESNIQHPTFNIQSYPNPFTDKLFISLELPEKADVIVRVYNTTGTIVSSMDFPGCHAGRFESIWQAASLPDGIYFCKITIGNESVTRKVVKAN